MGTSTLQGRCAVEQLLEPGCFDHAVDKPRLLETHISWIVLTGRYAYKIKKPLDLGFLDFTTLERRLFYCQEELRLNRRLAPELYLEVVPVTREQGRLRFGGPGEPVEYAVKMEEFPQAGLFDRKLKRGELTAEMIDELADQVAVFHRSIPAAEGEAPFGNPEQIQAPALENFDDTLPILPHPNLIPSLQALRRWTVDRFAELGTFMALRKEQGFVRECHGDLHTGNVALHKDRVVIFDCIEFCDNFRWIDGVNEVAFLFSDLEHHGRPDLAWRMLNRYLEGTGDYAGLRLLRYYLVYRLMVRAKIDCLRLQQELSRPERLALETDVESYLQGAEAVVRAPQPWLVLMRGPSGAGKTVQSQALLEAAGAVRIRSDVERKRLFDLDSLAHTGSEVGAGIYTPDASRRTYERLLTLAGGLLEAGLPVIVDATFLGRRSREPFRELAHRAGVAFRVLDVTAPETLLRRRVSERASSGEDASEADLAVLESQLVGYRPLPQGPGVVAVDGAGAPDPAKLLEALRGS